MHKAMVNMFELGFTSPSELGVLFFRRRARAKRDYYGLDSGYRREKLQRPMSLGRPRTD